MESAHAVSLMRLSPFLTGSHFLQASVSRLQLDNALLQEQKATQLDELNALKVDSKRHQESDAAVIAKYQDQISWLKSDSKRTIQRRTEEDERRLVEANRSVGMLCTDVDSGSLGARVPPAHEKVISVLEVKPFKQQANAIGRRQEGNLVSGITRVS
jgi:hypothetical protein